MLGDIFVSIGVIIAAFVIFLKPDWAWADPLCTYFFSFIAIYITLPVLKNCILVLLEGTPDFLDCE